MSSQVQSRNISAYLGVNAVNPPNVWLRKKNPNNAANSPDFTNYTLGDLWINTVLQNTWLLQNKTGSVGSIAAPATPTWVQISTGVVPIEFVWNSVLNPGLTPMFQQNGYYTNAGGLVTFVLPTVAAAGSVIEIAGFSGSSWILTQNAGQEIYFRGIPTSIGVAGNLTPAQPTARVALLCIFANTTWIDISCGGSIAVN